MFVLFISMNPSEQILLYSMLSVVVVFSRTVVNFVVVNDLRLPVTVSACKVYMFKMHLGFLLCIVFTSGLVYLDTANVSVAVV